MPQTVARKQAITEIERPRPAEGVRRTEKSESAPKVVAHFIANFKEYRLGLKAVLVSSEYGKHVTQVGTGDHIQFHDWKAAVEGEDRIESCLKNKRFQLDFDIDDSDPSGYWEEHGWIERKIEQVSTVRRVQKIAVDPSDSDDCLIPAEAKG